MRKIEEKMITAMCLNREWRRGNTRVRNYSKCQRVFLFNNMIYKHERWGKFVFNDAGFPTKTTVSRLNAIAGMFHDNIAFLIKRGVMHWRLRFEGVWRDMGECDYLNHDMVNDALIKLYKEA